ncbi:MULTISPECIES: GntR family transcriptional regulator [Marinobacter]|jgi:DNA-binding GntR family transcriptional regulator|uniref:DNA-binding transcriptional regulator, GntR family n=1 Tax=Marinobacter salarius TaxID=1420917 RepID=W5YPZ0_9GAMM|nr:MULTISPECIES: GntR family transcriptional regulator [Marinobacter]AHI31191.1 GntR family transcriptional regulator [Marinobacter salarius]ARM84410.1 transcriptional regulator PdhR [Marinobacter salarius]KXJ45051.1 MAG: GntR family transcriptional regulator [Marinobacter sp. Hex_13]MAB50221.1 GntR family transcriptional regulator [Marinobacter sp.]MBL83116.1 GntR family transcriptional regulator [Marinobacter sp.]|tara:strand:- start:596 stop:1279 length:684 start_codon:yes stop_codon:yes gene_type:complete
MRFQAPESLSEQIAQHLGQRIVTGDLRPGERIQELKVAGELNVSRGSVREALLILQRRHLVDIFPRRGAVVSRLTPELVNSLYDIYIDLLCMLGRKVLERWSGSELSGVMGQVRELQAVIDALNSSGGDAAEQVIDAGFGVMRYAYGLVENPFLEETLENFRPAISRTYFVALENFRDELAETGRFFRQLADAAVRDDAAGLETAICEFGEHQREQVLSILREEVSA